MAFDSRQTYLVSFVGSDKKGITTFGNDIVWMDKTLKAEDIPEIKQAVAFKQKLVAITILNIIPVKT